MSGSGHDIDHHHEGSSSLCSICVCFGALQVPGLFYAGSHGFDITGPHAESMRYQARAIGLMTWQGAGQGTGRGMQ